jgi:hypothetical protein
MPRYCRQFKAAAVLSQIHGAKEALSSMEILIRMFFTRRAHFGDLEDSGTESNADLFADTRIKIRTFHRHLLA